MRSIWLSATWPRRVWLPMAAPVSVPARAAARRGLEIDDSLAEAHASLAHVKANYEWDWPEAERLWRRAIALISSGAAGPRMCAPKIWPLGRTISLAKPFT